MTSGSSDSGQLPPVVRESYLQEDLRLDVGSSGCTLKAGIINSEPPAFKFAMVWQKEKKCSEQLQSS